MKKSERRALCKKVKAHCKRVGLFMRCKAYPDEMPAGCFEPNREWRCCVLCPRLSGCRLACRKARKIEREFVGEVEVRPKDWI